MIIDNCAPYDIVLARNEVLRVLKFEQEDCIHFTEQTIAAVISGINQKFPKVPKKKFSKTEIEQKANLQVPNEYKHRCLDILFKHQDAISINKFNLGRAITFSYRIHLKDNNSVYQKLF
jgi:hypothetical protein